jgi:hypothetical protein
MNMDSGNHTYILPTEQVNLLVVSCHDMRKDEFTFVCRVYY